jgi:aryl carrier-like protein
MSPRLERVLVLSRRSSTSGITINRANFQDRSLGRRGRFYKTGDLVRQNPDGSLNYIGRQQETQVKLHGQRIELEAVAHVVQQTISEVVSAVAQVVQPAGATSSADLLLTCFLELDGHESDTPVQPQYYQVSKEDSIELVKQLPAYMIPSMYFSIAKLPLTVNGKVDRKGLESLAVHLRLDGMRRLISAGNGSKRQPSFRTERTMQRIWAKILNISSENIGPDDTFLGLGGNSMSSMRLVGEARKLDMKLSVADVFRSGTLAALAQSAKLEPRKTHPTFNAKLVSDAKTESLSCDLATLSLEHAQREEVADIVPVTSLQERCLTGGILQVRCEHNHNCGHFAN